MSTLNTNKTIVLNFGWMEGKPKYVQKYSDLYRSLGFKNVFQIIASPKEQLII